MPESLQPLIAWLADHPGWITSAIFLTSLLESLAIAGILVPGVAILFGVAVLAGQTAMPLVELLAWGAAGAILGDGLSFWLGRHLQGHLHQVWPFRRHPKMIRRAEMLFAHHGGKSVVIGRFVGPVRPVVPLVAGAFNMPARTFLLVNVASAIVWAPCYLLPGYAVGHTLIGPEPIPPALYLAVAGGALALLLGYLLFFRLQLGLRNRSSLYLKLEQYMASYNASHRFWRQLSSERPNGGGEFPLASISLALGGTGGFVLWSAFSHASSLAMSLDDFFRSLSGYFRSPLTDPFLVTLTHLGDPFVLVAGALIMMALLAFRGYYSAATHLLGALALTACSITVLKNSFAVARPLLVQQPPDSYAFPSGHATGITVFLGLAAAFAAREWRPARRWQVYLAFSLPMLLVVFSRVALGVHWFSDVIGGLLLGLGICGVVRASYSRYDRTPLSIDIISVLGFVLWLGLLVGYVAWQWPETLAAYAPAAT